MSVLKVFIIIHCLVTSSYSLYRIVGGKQVKIDDVPYQLSLRRQGAHICGAALISEKYAVTAAHCLKVQALYTIRAGSDLKDEGGILTNVKTAILHPERSSHPYGFDIAILELMNPLPLTNKIQPIKLSEDSQLLVPGVKGLISGFGDTQPSEYTGSKVLRAVEVFVQNQDWCQNSYMIYGLTLSSMEFCAGVSEGEKDSCQGDSGGPFVIDNVLYGLVSYGLECGDYLHPGVYTSIPAFREFIRLNTGI